MGGKESLAWMQQGSCKDSTDLHFSGDPFLQELARKVCSDCPVLETCHDYALRRYQWRDGIVAGMDWRDREAARKRAGLSHPAKAPTFDKSIYYQN